MNLSQLQSQREALRSALYQGVLSVRAGDKTVTYKSNTEMKNALAALEQEIAEKEGRSKVKRILPYANKGL